MARQYKPRIQHIVTLALLFLSSTLWAQDFSARLKELSESSHRSDSNIARNQYRNPVETLEFFGLKADMKVVEIWPSSGWYTEILAPALAEHGQYFAAGFMDDGNEWRKQRNKEFSEKLKSRPELYAHARVTMLTNESTYDIVPPNTADMVLTFRNVHNWMKGDYAQQVFDQMFKALKPGGVLGVVEHRAKPGTTFEDQITSGYVTVEQVKNYAEKSGFKFVAASEVNANPKDSTQHPKGVWTLPPSLRLGDRDTEKYVEIGESDRMTLKFIKPEK